MKSTMENTMEFDNDHVMHIVPKELPDWYGIEDIGFVWHGEWADPEVEYKGKRCNCNIIEDAMWERFKEDYPNAHNENEFVEYMRNNKDEVYELCELAMT